MMKDDNAVDDLNDFKKLLIAIEDNVRASETAFVEWTTFFRGFKGRTVAEYYRSCVRPHVDLANTGVCIGRFGCDPILYESSLCLLAMLMDRARQWDAAVLGERLYRYVRASALGELEDAEQQLRVGGAE